MLVNEIVNNVETQGYEDFMKNYGDLEYQASWAGYSTTKRPRSTDGLISTYDLFDELGLNSEMVVNDIQKFIDEYGDLEILEDHYDNTYNYSGYLDRYVEFHYFELENDQVLVTLSVGLGLDPRSVYTKNVAMIFEDSYDFLEAFSTQFQLLDLEFRVDGKKYFGTFDGGALSEYGYLELKDENGEIVFDDESTFPTTDCEDMQDAISEILGKDQVTIDTIKYFWYAC
jgi:hypothetical protein